MINRCLLPGLAIALLGSACATRGPADANELWRDSPGQKECRIELNNPIGDVLITANPEKGSVAVVHGDPGLLIESSAGSGYPVLTVARVEPAHEYTADVEVSIPRDCDVEVRTVDGSVQLDLGEPAFSADIGTVTGNITACIAPDTAATVRFATSGEITTDFTITIDYKYHVEPAKHGSITLKPGVRVASESAVVYLHSRRGAVRMLDCRFKSRTLQPEKPAGETKR